MAHPNSRARPTYSAQRPATPASVGEGDRASAPGATGVTSAAETPTPNENAPDVRWPSVAETVRQATV